MRARFSTVSCPKIVTKFGQNDKMSSVFESHMNITDDQMRGAALLVKIYWIYSFFVNRGVVKSAVAS